MSDEVCYQLPVSIKVRLSNALSDATENAVELLCDHEQKLGRTTKKNTQTAEMYDKEIAELTQLRNELYEL